jgi:hypothetical protein
MGVFGTCRGRRFGEHSWRSTAFGFIGRSFECEGPEVATFKLVAEDKVAIEVGRSVKKENSYKSQVRAEHSGTLQPLSQAVLSGGKT